MKKTKKFMNTVFLITVIIFIVGSIIGYLLYNKPHRNVQKAKVDYIIDASVLLSEFESASAVSTKKYDGKILLVSGKVESVNFQESIASVSYQAMEAFLE